MNRLTVRLGRAKQIVETEGLVLLIRRGFSSVMGFFFAHGNYYLYQHATDYTRYLNEADFMPKIDNTARERLAKGGIAFFVFVGPELAHIGWVGLTEEAKRGMGEPPYKVDFSMGEACTGGAHTMEKYRGKGLMAYGYFERLQYLRGKGVITSRNVINTSNTASQRVHAKFDPKIYAQARYLRIIRWSLWKETPLTQNGHC